MKIIFDSEEERKEFIDCYCPCEMEQEGNSCNPGRNCKECWEDSVEMEVKGVKRIGVSDYMKMLKEKFKTPETTSKKCQKFFTREKP